jgi:hypothetical protein
MLASAQRVCVKLLKRCAVSFFAEKSIAFADAL